MATVESSAKAGLVSESPNTKLLWYLAQRGEGHPLGHTAKALIRCHRHKAKDYKIWDGTPRLLPPRFCPCPYTMPRLPAAFIKALRHPLSFAEYLDLLSSCTTLSLEDPAHNFRCLLMSSLCLLFIWLSQPLSRHPAFQAFWLEVHFILYKLPRLRSALQQGSTKMTGKFMQPPSSTAWYLDLDAFCRPLVATRRGALLGTRGPHTVPFFDPGWLFFLETLPYSWMAGTWTTFLSSTPTPPINNFSLPRANQDINFPVSTEHHRWW